MSGLTLTARREALLPALALVIKTVERRTTIPVLGNVLVTAADGRLTLTGTDLDLELSASLEAEITAPGAITLPHATFHDAVRKLPEGTQVTITADESFAVITGGRSRFRLPVLPATDFVTMNAGSFEAEFEIDAETLDAIVSTVGFAVSTEETRYYLNGIYWHVDNTQDAPMLSAVATDGHRLGKLSLPLPEGAAAMPGVIVPSKTVKLIKALGDKGKIAVSVSSTRVRMAAGNATMVSKLIDGTFPDYVRVIPQKHPNGFTVKRQALISAVDRMITMSSDRGSAVRFGFKAEDLSLSSVNPDLGSAEETVEIARIEGGDVEIGFNGRYCLDMLAATEVETVTFHLGEAGDPALITPSGDGQQPLFVLMPMRV